MDGSNIATEKINFNATFGKEGPTKIPKEILEKMMKADRIKDMVTKNKIVEDRISKKEEYEDKLNQMIKNYKENK